MVETYTAPVDWSTAIHGRSNGLTPKPGIPFGVIPRLIMPSSSRSVTGAVIRPKVRPPLVERATAMPPWGTVKLNGGRSAGGDVRKDTARVNRAVGPARFDRIPDAVCGRGVTGRGGETVGDQIRVRRLREATRMERSVSGPGLAAVIAHLKAAAHGFFPSFGRVIGVGVPDHRMTEHQVIEVAWIDRDLGLSTPDRLVHHVDFQRPRRCGAPGRALLPLKQ